MMTIINKVKSLHQLLSSFSEEVRDAYIAIETPIDYEVVKQYMKRGKWCAIHIEANTTKTGTTEIQIVPWLRSEDWPLGYTMPYMESVITNRKAGNFIVEPNIEMLNEFRSYCVEYKENWKTIIDTLSPLAKLFHAEKDLEYLHSFVFNDQNWPKDDEITDKELFERNKKVSLHFDNSKSNHLLWDLIKAYKDDTFIPSVPDFNLEHHEERILSSIANRAYLRGMNESFDKIEKQLMQAVCYSHGFGTESSDFMSKPSAVETSLEVFYPINFMFESFNIQKISEDIRSMPEFHIAESMNKQKYSYNGIAHMEVAAMMDEHYNNPQRAWKYLKAAGYWAGKNMPDAQETVLNAAMHLCYKHGWKEAFEVLEHNKKIMEH